MSEKRKNSQCQICRSYLFADDDVVICPTCGAPHHRDCWQTVGHCGAQDTHGTDNQYDKVQKMKSESEEQQEDGNIEQKCGFCGRTSKNEGAPFCPYCGQPYKNHGSHHPPFVVNGTSINFDPLGGVQKGTKIEGVDAEDIATFVGNNSGRYVNKFKTLNKGNKNSWNWLAFLFPSAFCLSRKMYSNGILFLIVSIAANLCFVPFNNTLASLGDIERMTREQLVSLATENMSAFTPLIWIMCAVGTVLFILPHIICGLRGDWMYRTHALSKIKTIKENKEINDYNTELKTKGSVSLGLMFLAFLVEQYVPIILAGFLW